MGQCMSRKAAGAYAASAAALHSKPTRRMQENTEEEPSLKSPGDEERTHPHPAGRRSKGVSTSFGFKRRAAAAPVAADAAAARRLARPLDRNGNGDTQPLAARMAPTGRSTPRLMPPKKGAGGARLNRFGFRQPQAERHKVSDLNGPFFGADDNAPAYAGYPAGDNNNRSRILGRPQQTTERYMLQSTHLPRPEPIRLIETKTAKTLMNNSRKISNALIHFPDHDNSSKDGSATEDSGVGSQTSGGVPSIDTISGVARLNCSPTYGARRTFNKSRNLEIVRAAGNAFDVRDLADDSNSEHFTPLPQLPSAFATPPPNKIHGAYNSVGFVRERAKEYERHLDDNRRKMSLTSSDGFSDDHGEEKTTSDKYKPEKKFVKPSALQKSFLKAPFAKDDSSQASSDEQEWGFGGEAMADEVSFSITSSSDESKDNRFGSAAQRGDNINLALESLAPAPPNSAVLVIEDLQFAAAADAGLLDDETSPVDSLLSSGSDAPLKRKLARSSSNSKDINEKLTPPSPGTPTNASNSLSLSDGKDDFLIDDEIADQPALVFEETVARAGNLSQTNSESTPTICNSTPKPRRRPLMAFEGSPLSLRKKKAFHSRAGSLDTLSPCESIASDDLMMDYEYSQSSGLDDLERNESRGFSSLDDTLLRKPEITDDNGVVLRDWSALLGTYPSDKSIRSNPSKASRLLWSRTGTPNSIPDSPKSVDGKPAAGGRSRHSITSSPLRLSRPSLSTGGYDSDDSIRLDRANHTAMKQDIISMKTMLLKLRRILNESETHIPFDGQLTLINGLFNGVCSDDHTNDNHLPGSMEDADDSRLELAELRRQVLFLQGQLEDKDRTVQHLQQEMVRLGDVAYSSAPASTAASDSNDTCNAATQTDRIRPISAGPALLNASGSDSSVGSLVSASETKKRPPIVHDPPKKPSSKLWRQPGEPPSPQRFTSSSIPRRAHSRTRTPSVPS